jgi:hypothetical protein
MTRQHAWRGSDATIPNVARIYDFLLDGKDNYPADREAAARLLAAVPDAKIAARDNREFLGRAVRFLAGEAGIRQFLDIGTGLPARGSVHQIADAAGPASRVVYADNDPMVTIYSNALLADAPTVAAVTADLRDPPTLLTSPAVRALSSTGLRILPNPGSPCLRTQTCAADTGKETAGRSRLTRRRSRLAGRREPFPGELAECHRTAGQRNRCP